MIMCKFLSYLLHLFQVNEICPVGWIWQWVYQLRKCLKQHQNELEDHTDEVNLQREVLDEMFPFYDSTTGKLNIYQGLDYRMFISAMSFSKTLENNGAKVMKELPVEDEEEERFQADLKMAVRQSLVAVGSSHGYRFARRFSPHQ
ncbi:hypothetical protein P8452_51962 [Trifolium repens]|nr:hypothetical protein P8452_51962 [Trifolium repens]